MFALLLICLLCGLASVHANNVFTFPPSNGVNVLINSKNNISWTCDDCGSDPISLSVYQEEQDGDWASQSLLVNVQGQQSYIWTAQTFQGLTTATGFHFSLYYGDNGFSSGALFISNSLNSTSTSSPTTITSSTPTYSTLPPSAQTNSVPTSTDQTSEDKEVLKVGLGIGLGIGIPFFLLICGIVGYMIFRKRHIQDTTQEPVDMKREWSSNRFDRMELGVDGSRHELPGRSRPSELRG